MFAQIYRNDPGAGILFPALPDPANLLAPAKFGPNLTIPNGMSLGRKTTTNLLYPFNKDAVDGTQNWCGFNQVSGATDANGIFYKVFSGTPAGIDYEDTGIEAGVMYTSGVFDPLRLYTAATGTATAEVDTATPAGTITAGDLYTVYGTPGTASAGISVAVVVNATATATATVTQFKAAWAADPAAAALATTSGTATLILTAVNAGVAMSLNAAYSGVGTFAIVITTPATYAQQTEVDTFTPTGTVTTGDIYTMTINYPNGNTHVITQTVGATATATAISGLMIAAWNADIAASNYATATGTSTVVLTSTAAANYMNVTSAVTGVSTFVKVVTTPALGRNIADIQLSRPAYILQPYGYWRLP